MSEPGDRARAVPWTTEIHTTTPDLARLLATSLLPRSRGTTLPKVRLELLDHEVEAAQVIRYAEVCGFTVANVVPATSLHVVTFPLQVALMARGDFPLPLPGLVHVENRIDVLADIEVGQRVSVLAWAENLRTHPRGTSVELCAEVSADGRPVWRGRSTYLARGHAIDGLEGADGPGDAHRASTPSGPDAPDAAASVLKVPADQGRRYAAVSGDVNPIHLNPLTAKVFGFKRAIAHGMWTHARSLASIAHRVEAPMTVTAEFSQPVLLPSHVGLHVADADGAWTVEMRSRDASRLHVRTVATPAG